MLKRVMAVFGLLLMPTLCGAADSTDDSTRIGFTSSLIELSVRDYYSLFGSWPSSWKAVQESGLCSAQLIAPNGSALNPDDPNLDFPGDIAYMPKADGLPQLKVWNTSKGQDLIYDHPIQAPGKQEMHWGLDETVQIRLLGSIWSTGIPRFVALNKRLPESWADLVSSGTTPIDTSSINAMTGKPYQGDGSPGDFHLQLRRDDAGKVEALRFVWVDMEGREVVIVHEWLGYFPDPSDPNRFKLDQVD